jgi:RHS repeat-associated protein
VKFHCAFLTQKERDNESGLDYFLARYYSSAQGRFTSADEPLIDQWQGDPQSWNLYVYVRNNPLIFTDPTGMWHYDETEIDGKKHKIAVGDYDNEYLKGAGYWNAKTGEWGKYHDWTPGLSSFSRGVFLDLARRETASIKLINIAANITLTPISIISGTGLFRAGLTTLELAEAANAARLLLRSGQLLETTIQTSKGPVDVLAEVVVQGDKLVLKDLVIYGRGAEPLTGLTREMLGALSKVKEVARSLGFKQLQIIAKRVASSTSANPGHIVDVTIKL